MPLCGLPGPPLPPLPQPAQLIIVTQWDCMAPIKNSFWIFTSQKWLYYVSLVRAFRGLLLKQGPSEDNWAAQSSIATSSGNILWQHWWHHPWQVMRLVYLSSASLCAYPMSPITSDPLIISFWTSGWKGARSVQCSHHHHQWWFSWTTHTPQNEISLWDHCRVNLLIKVCLASKKKERKKLIYAEKDDINLVKFSQQTTGQMIHQL